MFSATRALAPRSGVAWPSGRTADSAVSGSAVVGLSPRISNTGGYAITSRLPEPPEQPGREEGQLADELERAADRDPDDPEGDEQEPDERVENDGQEGERPAQDEEDAPEKEFQHWTKAARVVPSIQVRYRSAAASSTSSRTMRAISSRPEEAEATISLSSVRNSAAFEVPVTE